MAEGLLFRLAIPPTLAIGGMGLLKSEIEELLKRIEELRLKMIRIKEGKAFSDPEVLAASQDLDAVLDDYQEMLLNMSEKD
ncbi:aspartyl-phosphate phosphatase Spo0E family protein [Desulfosporosinus sp. PR]|nr:aspartyl-phosphate phosphatase Spo0E family protein [Desulfosporosinus sp. PR]